MSTMGIYGLSGSGIDVESMVRVGMMSKQSQYDKMYQKEVKQEWEKEKFNEVYSEMSTFSMSTLTQYKLQSNMNAMSATSTNSNAVSVSANGSAVAMSHKIEVKSLSSNAYLMTTEAGIARASSDDSNSDSINLADIAFKSITANESDSKKYDVTDASGNTTTVNASDKAISFKLSDGSTTLSDDESTISFTYEELANGVTLNDLASKINGLGTNIRASYDSVNDSFSLYNSEGGSANNISITIADQEVTAEATKATLQSTSAIMERNESALTGSQTTFLSELGDDATVGVQRANGWKFTLQEGSDNVYQSVDDPNVTATKESDDTFTLRRANQSAPTSGFTVDSNGNYQSDTNSNESYVLEEDGTYTYTVKNDNFTEGYVYNNNEDFIAASKVNTTDPAQVAITGDTKLSALLGENSGTVEFTVNVGDGDSTITLDASNTVDSLVSALKEKGVTASFTNGRLTLSDTDTGSASTISISAESGTLGESLVNALNLNAASATGTDTVYASANTASNTAALFTNLRLGQSANGTLSDAKTFATGSDNTVSGTNGEVVIDGKTYSDTITNNRVTVAGVTYTLLNTTDSAETVTVTQDTSSIIDRVKSFVDDYNKMLDYMRDLYTETRYSDYKPLTKTQENAMTEKQIEKWTEKAKSGLLYHNSIIGDIISNMREALSTPIDGVTGKYNSAFNLGISVTKTYGYIELDESKLKEALEADPECVYNVFGKLDDADDEFEEIGVAQRLGDVMTDAMKKVKDYAGTSTSIDDDSTLGNSIRDWQTKMSNFQLQLNAYETKLFAKYDAMEQMIQKLGMQMNYLGFGSSS